MEFTKHFVILIVLTEITVTFAAPAIFPSQLDTNLTTSQTTPTSSFGPGTTQEDVIIIGEYPTTKAVPPISQTFSPVPRETGTTTELQLTTTTVEPLFPHNRILGPGSLRNVEIDPVEQPLEYASLSGIYPTDDHSSLTFNSGDQSAQLAVQQTNLALLRAAQQQIYVLRNLYLATLGNFEHSERTNSARTNSARRNSARRNSERRNSERTIGRIEFGGYPAYESNHKGLHGGMMGTGGHSSDGGGSSIEFVHP